MTGEQNLGMDPIIHSANPSWGRWRAFCLLLILALRPASSSGQEMVVNGVWAESVESSYCRPHVGVGVLAMTEGPVMLKCNALEACPGQAGIVELEFWTDQFGFVMGTSIPGDIPGTSDRLVRIAQQASVGIEFEAKTVGVLLWRFGNCDAPEVVREAGKEETVEEVNPTPEISSDLSNAFAEMGGNRSAEDGEIEGVGEPGLQMGVLADGGKMIGAPTLKDVPSTEGVVRIKVYVDQSGQVKEARFDPENSTTSSSQLVQLAMESAQTATFESHPTKPTRIGWIEFNFKLD